VNQSFQVTQASQTITFGALSNQSFGTAPFTISATASSGLVVSFASTTTSVCTMSSKTVTLVAAGTCTIQATQTGNANYSAATPVSQSFQVTQESQTITFGALSNKIFGAAPFTVKATASSGLAVSFGSTTSAICTVAGSTVTIVAAGTCTVQATQAGNTNYAAATPVNQSFQVTQASQTITFGSLSNKNFGTAPFTVKATASSGLAVSFASTTSAVCTVAGSTVTLVAVGTCTIQATQSGNSNYAAAAPVNQSFQVTKGSQTITFGPLSSQFLGTNPFALTATTSSGLAVSFASTTLSVCTVSGSTVTLVAVGTCTIQATQSGNSNYNAATPVNQSFQVTKGT
jgi:coenzyme F420-reducing hydrogenase gamma subunit